MADKVDKDPISESQLQNSSVPIILIEDVGLEKSTHLRRRKPSGMDHDGTKEVIDCIANNSCNIEPQSSSGISSHNHDGATDEKCLSESSIKILVDGEKPHCTKVLEGAKPDGAWNPDDSENDFLSFVDLNSVPVNTTNMSQAQLDSVTTNCSPDPVLPSGDFVIPGQHQQSQESHDKSDATSETKSSGR